MDVRWSSARWSEWVRTEKDRASISGTLMDRFSNSSQTAKFRRQGWSSPDGGLDDQGEVAENFCVLIYMTQQSCATVMLVPVAKPTRKLMPRHYSHR